MDISLLKHLGFSDKAATVYLSLLSLGPSSVRTLAEHVGINRGTTYDALKWLQDEGIVSYYKKDSKQHFVAESPEKLHNIVRQREEELARVDKKLTKIIPELKALHDADGERPIARYYGRKDLNHILEDILSRCEESNKKEYYIYSAEGLREYLYESFPNFSDVRIGKGIYVHVIAVGEGGELRGLDERKWIKHSAATPTYIIIYPGKTAYISLDAKGEPMGVVIENDGVYTMQKMIFEQLWNSIS